MILFYFSGNVILVMSVRTRSSEKHQNYYDDRPGLRPGHSLSLRRSPSFVSDERGRVSAGCANDPAAISR